MVVLFYTYLKTHFTNLDMTGIIIHFIMLVITIKVEAIGGDIFYVNIFHTGFYCAKGKIVMSKFVQRTRSILQFKIGTDI